MSANDQRTVRPGTRTVSSAVVRRTRRLRLVVECLRSHDRLAEPASAYDAYRSWASATGPRARAAFWRYTTALDAEERAAEVYESLVRRVGRLATIDNLSGPLAA